MRDGVISRWDGLVLVALFVIYILRFVKAEIAKKETDDYIPRRQSVMKILSIVIIAGLAMYFGAELIVLGAKGLIQTTPLLQTFVGTIIVGLAMTVPNGFLIIYASRKARTNLSFSNLIGDSIVSIPLLLGVVALIYPLTIAADSMFLLPTFAAVVVLFALMLYGDLHSLKIKGEPDIKKSEALTLIIAYVIITYFTLIW
jgi:cation:H+ antiporter